MSFEPSAGGPEEKLRLAEKILLYSRRYITQQAPLMLAPIYALRQEALPVPAPMATDGVRLFYSPEQVIADFQQDRNAPARQLLHATLHCLLGHLEAKPYGEGGDLFDDLADLKAAQFAKALSAPLAPPREGGIFAYTAPLAVLFQRGLADKGDREELTRFLRKMNLRLDDHSLWRPPAARAAAVGGEGNASPDGTSAPEKGSEGQGGQGGGPDWKGMLQNLNDQARNDPSWGSAAGFLQEEYAPAQENGISYSDFLRRFAAPNERLLLDPDSFDPRWYYLGLEQYGNIPLLEPSELSEPPLPDDIVLALDTSGSCSGEVCSRFLRETLSLLRDISAGAPRFRVLALQCDAEIQREVLLESSDQLDGFLEDFTPRGFGGTDFCPVFERVAALREEGTLPRVRGLLYLSDGYGDFPEEAPDYPVTFLLLKEDDMGWGPHLPDWVSALTLDTDDFTLKEATE